MTLRQHIGVFLITYGIGLWVGAVVLLVQKGRQK